MNPWLFGCAALLVGGLVPAVILSLRGPDVHRLVGLQLTGSVAVLAMLLLCQGLRQASYLIVPTVLVVLSFAGTLVFTRLLGRGE
jgi:multisubunit Na+/H+ antiporter MnhF subunit